MFRMPRARDTTHGTTTLTAPPQRTPQGPRFATPHTEPRSTQPTNSGSARRASRCGRLGVLPNLAASLMSASFEIDRSVCHWHGESRERRRRVAGRVSYVGRRAVLCVDFEYFPIGVSIRRGSFRDRFPSGHRAAPFGMCAEHLRAWSDYKRCSARGRGRQVLSCRTRSSPSSTLAFGLLGPRSAGAAALRRRSAYLKPSARRTRTTRRRSPTTWWTLAPSGRVAAMTTTARPIARRTTPAFT